MRRPTRAAVQVSNNFKREHKMKITKSTLRRIIREEAARLVNEQPDPAQDEQGSATVSELMMWFKEKRDGIRDMGIPAAQIRPLINAMDDAIAAAQAGALKKAGRRLGAMMDKITGPADGAQ